MTTLGEWMNIHLADIFTVALKRISLSGVLGWEWTQWLRGGLKKFPSLLDLLASADSWGGAIDLNWR